MAMIVSPKVAKSPLFKVKTLASLFKSAEGILIMVEKQGHIAISGGLMAK